MKQYKRIQIAVLFFTLLLIGCSKSAAPNTEQESEPTITKLQQQEDDDLPNHGSTNNDGFRVGTVVSDAYVNPNSIPTVAPEQIKAKGFVYDYETLAYDLVWSDEFDYEGLPDDTKWNYDVGGGGWGNAELQYYTKGENVYVKDGYLTIEARKEKMNGNDYTSTRLITKGKGDWLYGKIEVRAKLPTGVGTWPAIWLLPTDWVYGSWPASGEIDIMEHVGYDQNVIHGSIHTQSYYHSIGTQKTNNIRVEGVSDDFHVYAVEWLPDKVIISVDEKQYFTFDPTKFKTNPTYKEWPFDKRMHLLINFAVGGGWGGARGVDETIYPQQMQIDYVRVYQSETINSITKGEENNE